MIIKNFADGRTRAMLVSMWDTMMENAAISVRHRVLDTVSYNTEQTTDNGTQDPVGIEIRKRLGRKEY